MHGNPPESHPVLESPGAENDKNNIPNKVSTAPRWSSSKLLADVVCKKKKTNKHDLKETSLHFLF